MSYQPLVSVVITVYNCESFVAESIRSVLSQTYGKIEVLVVDDCSTDRSWDIVRSFGPRVRTVRHDDNQGVSAATNTGIGIASGEYVKLHNGDDVMHPEAIEDLVRVLNDWPETREMILVHNMEFFGDASGLITGSGPVAVNRQDGSLAERDYVAMTALQGVNAMQFFSRQLTSSIGGFDTRFAYTEDYEFNLRAYFEAGICVWFVDRCLVDYRKHGSGLSDIGQLEMFRMQCIAIDRLCSKRRMFGAMLYGLRHRTVNGRKIGRRLKIYWTIMLMPADVGVKMFCVKLLRRIGLV